MKLQALLRAVARLMLAAALVAAGPVGAQARSDELSMPEVSEDDLRPNIPQPYIVKKGDTLWDIAKYFFKDPLKWYKIWERNLYITNPDLIYPGNEIWFDVRQKKTGGLTTVRPEPQAIVKPVERLEARIDPTLVVSALRRQDFISPAEVQGVGYILEGEDERIHFGADDRLYLKLNREAKPGDRFDVFRTGDPVRDPKTHRVVGVLVEHLGRVEITGRKNGLYRSVVTEAFAELARGDRLKPARDVDTRLEPVYPGGTLSGSVMYIRDHAAEAGQGQVVGINLGSRQGLSAGAVLSVHKAGRKVRDPVTGKRTTLPEEKIGELIVLVPQPSASIALVTSSERPINIGDTVRNQASR